MTFTTTEMSKNEILKITQIALSLGISQVKITGGEPLIRSDILSVVEGIAKLRGVRDLSMTTNGILLSAQAKGLRSSGLRRVNVNIPTLNPRIYRELIGGNLEEVVNGIRAAVDVGLHPVKLNMLVLKGLNEKEIPQMIDFSKKNKTILQLIELEPINLDQSYYSSYHRSLNGFEAKLAKQASRIETRRNMQNRRIYFLHGVEVEVVRPIENTEFCSHCTRIRVTSDGKLKPCLMRNDNLVDILSSLRKGADDEALRQLFIKAIKRREPYFKTMGD